MGHDVVTHEVLRLAVQLCSGRCGMDIPILYMTVKIGAKRIVQLSVEVDQKHESLAFSGAD